MKHHVLIAALLSLVIFVNGQENNDTLNKVDSKGLKHGYWKKEVKDTLKYEGRFNHGVPTGLFLYYYYPEKTIKTRMEYSSNGTIAKSTSYFPNTEKLAEGTYINKQKEGLWLFYDGYGHVISKDYFKNGQKHGICKSYYQDGKILEYAEYSNGKKNGKWIVYFKDSVPRYSVQAVNDVLEGKAIYYHPNGLTYEVGEYKKGLRDGEWKMYDTEGKPILNAIYSEGRFVSKTVFQKDKDPETLQQKDSELEIKNKGKSSTESGFSDPRLEGY